VRRRRPNPVAFIGAIIAVAIAAWLTNTRQESPRPAPSLPRVEQQRPAPEPQQPREEATQRETIDPQLQATLDLIERGGPFPHRQDGTVFQNREGNLPAKPRGYYREYTVPTPGAKNRGARRVVVGEGGEKWYTEDHYRTFVRLD